MTGIILLATFTDDEDSQALLEIQDCQSHHTYIGDWLTPQLFMVEYIFSSSILFQMICMRM